MIRARKKRISKGTTSEGRALGRWEAAMNVEGDGITILNSA
jgi:hypothetical protein